LLRFIDEPLKRKRPMLLQLDSFNTTPKLLKAPAIFVVAIGITFSLFAFMQFLIASPTSVETKAQPEFDISLYQARRESDVKITPKLTPPPPMKVKPQRQTHIPSETTITDSPTFKPMIEFELKTTDAGTDFTKQDGQAQAIVRIPAKYPPVAARNGIEGWVELRFNIDPTGRVIDAEVVNAEPKKVFDRAALKALKHWKYKPKIENGQAQIQYNQSVLLEFNLEQG